MGKATGKYKRVEKGLVYKLVCIPNGRVYIGQTKKTLASRVYNHFWKAAGAEVGLLPMTHLYSDIIQYGQINFEISVLETDIRDDFRRVELETKHILAAKEAGVSLYNKVEYFSPVRPTKESLEKSNSKRSAAMKEIRKNKKWNKDSSMFDRQYMDLEDI